MKSFADVRRRMKPGVQLLTVEHTTRPTMVGLVRTVMRVQTNGFWWTRPDDIREVWTDYPKSTEVTILDADTFKMSPAYLNGHYVTLRFTV